MKRSMNKQLKCPNCPHHYSKSRCYCPRGSISTVKSKLTTSRPKKQPSTIDNTSMINSTIPTIIAQFSALRTENNHLKRQLLNVSTFLKDDANNSISLTQNDISLSEKLFLSNKNLKQAMIQIDNLSKMNKQLNEQNTHLTQECQGVKIQLKEMQAYCLKYKKRCKQYSQNRDQMSSKEQYEKMKRQNYYLQQEIQKLQDEIKGYRYEQFQPRSSQTLSHDWIAHTSNKMYKPQHMIYKQESGPFEMNLQIFKRKITQTITNLKAQTLTFSLSSSCTYLNNLQTLNFEKLIQIMLEVYSESIFRYFSILTKEIDRKMNNYEKKLNNMIGKIQNFLIIFKNKKLKKKMTSNLSSFIKTERIPMMDITNFQQ